MQVELTASDCKMLITLIEAGNSRQIWDKAFNSTMNQIKHKLSNAVDLDTQHQIPVLEMMG